METSAAWSAGWCREPLSGRSVRFLPHMPAMGAVGAHDRALGDACPPALTRVADGRMVGRPRRPPRRGPGEAP
jgi:hypothetical protein